MPELKRLFYTLPTAAALLFARAAAAVETGLNRTADVAGLRTGSTDLPTRIGQIIGVALSLVGIIFLILMIYGGFIWMTATGDAEKIKKAKNMITSAIIGLVIIAGAYAITFFVLNQILEATGQASGTT